MIKRRVIKICEIVVIISLVYTMFFSFVQATQEDTDSSKTTSNVNQAIQFDDYVTKINEYIKESGMGEELNVEEIAGGLLTNDTFEYDSIIKNVLAKVFNEILVALKNGISIFIIVILMSILKGIELDKDTSVSKVTYFACYIVIATLCIKTFVVTIDSFKGTVDILTTLMQIISPFLMTILIATGAISSVGIIQPMLLFLASFIGFLVNYLVIPFLTISVAFNIVNSITDKLSLSRLSNMFSKVAIWVVGVFLTIFLSVLSLESSVTSSIDSLAVKTTQAAVSNFVPVVGKFFSDSFETVVGATKIVGRVGGTVGIIAIIGISLIPVIKILATMITFYLLSALSGLVGTNEKIMSTLDMFADTYKTLLGILIGIIILFVISTGIILNLSTAIIK